MGSEPSTTARAPSLPRTSAGLTSSPRAVSFAFSSSFAFPFSSPWRCEAGVPASRSTPPLARATTLRATPPLDAPAMVSVRPSPFTTRDSSMLPRFGARAATVADRARASRARRCARRFSSDAAAALLAASRNAASRSSSATAPDDAAGFASPSVSAISEARTADVASVNSNEKRSARPRRRAATGDRARGRRVRRGVRGAEGPDRRSRWIRARRASESRAGSRRALRCARERRAEGSATGGRFSASADESRRGSIAPGYHRTGRAPKGGMTETRPNSRPFCSLQRRGCLTQGS